MAADRSASDYLDLDPARIGAQESYRWLVHSVAPRPIAFVSTRSAEGDLNLAPYSFFMAGGANPPSLAFSPTSNRAGQAKHTLRNIQETREFTVNIVDHALTRQMNQTSLDYPDGVSEWSEAGLTPLAGAVVGAPYVQGAPMALECRLHTIVTHGEGPSSANYVIGEVVYFHIARRLLDAEQRIDVPAVDYVARLGGDYYTRVTPGSLFELARPEAVEHRSGQTPTPTQLPGARR